MGKPKPKIEKTETKMTPPKSQPHRTKYNLPVVVYFTKEQKKKVAEAADRHGQNLSAYLRGEALKAAEQAEQSVA